MSWTEVADEVFQRRYEPYDVSVCVVRGRDGLLVVDTRASHRQADEVIDHLRALGPRPVRWVVNTHAHFDHTFGNARFPGAVIWGHERLPAHLDEYERPMLAGWIARGEEPADEWRDVRITPPVRLVGDRAAIDLGDRGVELLHLGRGHTDNDLLLHVPDAGAWLVGDVVEESGPPMYGSGSFPLDWPGTVAELSRRLTTDDAVVPGHGDPVTAGFVAAQQRDLAAVADLVRELHAAGVPAERAVDDGGDRWPFPADGMAAAVRDGYAQLALGGT